jgi:glycosyltransferase involved in cell wall biosynthesis
VPALHQFVPTLDPGAVGAHVLEIQRTLREAGWESEVLAEHEKPPHLGRTHRYTDYGTTVRARGDDVVVYHAAIGSSVADWLMDRRTPRLVVDYHNITPPLWFEGWEPPVADGLTWGRAQLRRLTQRARFGLADSAFNAAELERVGLRRTAVLPILVPEESLGGAPDRERVAELRAEPGARWIFVGRLAPNKRQHLLIAALSAYRRAFDPAARLDLVGGATSPTYEAALRSFAHDLGLDEAVTLTGAVSEAERDARYAAADVFVCLSAHEGFLVPLLEAWHHRVPVIAYDAAAVPETLGDAGLLLHSTAADVVATAAARVVGDPAVGAALRAAGDARLDRYSLGRARTTLLELAEALAGGLADPPGLDGLRARR